LCTPPNVERRSSFRLLKFFSPRGFSLPRYIRSPSSPPILFNSVRGSREFSPSGQDVALYVPACRRDLVLVGEFWVQPGAPSKSPSISPFPLTLLLSLNRRGTIAVFRPPQRISAGFFFNDTWASLQVVRTRFPTCSTSPSFGPQTGFRFFPF